MTPKKFQTFIQDNEIWFRGSQPEPEAKLQEAESQLGVSFPHSLRWLLTNYGYWKATGTHSLQNIVQATLLRRPDLPKQMIVLAHPTAASFDRWHDCDVHQEDEQRLGLVVLETKKNGDEGTLYWGRGPQRNQKNSQKNLVQFHSFSDYLIERVQRLKQNPDTRYWECCESFSRILDGWNSPYKLTKKKERFLKLLGETVSWCATKPAQVEQIRQPSIVANADILASLQSVRQYDLANVSPRQSMKPQVMQSHAKPMPVKVTSAKTTPAKPVPSEEEITNTASDSAANNSAVAFLQHDIFFQTGSSPRQVIRPAKDLAGGRLLITQTAQSKIADSDSSVTESSNGTGLDRYDQPPSATWVCIVSGNPVGDNPADNTPTGDGLSRNPTGNHQYLVSWIPPHLVQKITQTLQQRPVIQACWIENWNSPFRQALQDHGLIA